MSPRALLAGSWTLVILLLCWFPRSMMGPIEEGPRPFFIPNLDKLVHLGIFAVFGALWMRAGAPARRVLLAGLTLAVVSELGQQMPFVHRDASVADGLADAIGLALGIAGSTFADRALARRAARPRG